MPNFKPIINISETNIGNDWTTTNKFKSGKLNGKLVEFLGDQYEVVDEKERVFSSFERGFRKILGYIATIFTLSIAYFSSKSVRNLFKSKETMRFGVKAIQSSQKPLGIQGTQKPLNIDEIRQLLHPKAGAKTAGGKDIQKVNLFSTWLNQDYTNKQSPTYQAYQSLAKSENLNNALFVGMRGDGDCGFRAISASMLLELAKDPKCTAKFNLLVDRLDDIVKNNRNVLPGFANLNSDCLQTLKNCKGSPQKLIELINNDQFMGGLTRMFRFLSNALCEKNYDALPEEVKIQLDYGDGAQELGRKKFLQTHATVDVDSIKDMKAYFFADVTQILVLAQALGISYWIGIVNEGQKNPEEPNTYAPSNGSLLTMNMLCRDKRHFDVILPF